MTDQFLCGAARANITPPETLLPNLRGLRDGRFGGILDDLFVRALAIGDGEHRALIISFDLDKAPYPQENLALLSQRAGIPEENIFFFSSHTHTAPITGFRPDEPPNDMRRNPIEVQQATVQYEQLVAAAMLHAVDEALAGMRPVRMGWAFADSYINVNRSQEYQYVDEHGALQTEVALGANPQAPVDRRVFVLKFEDLHGQPVGFLMNYQVHNCVMHANQCFDGKMGISGDIGGRVSAFLEQNFPGCVALWSSGAAGDINPLFQNEIYYPDPLTGRPMVEIIPGGDATLLTVLAARHFADVMNAVRQIECTIHAAPIAAAVDWLYTPGRNVVTHDDGEVEIQAGEGVDPYEIRLHLLRLGDLAFYGFSGELFSSLGRRLQEIAPLYPTLIINHDVSLMARSNYIFDDNTYTRDVHHQLPGRRQSRMLPCTVRQALESQTLSLFARLADQTDLPQGV